MIAIDKNGDLVTRINSLSCERQNQQLLIDLWIRATKERGGPTPWHYFWCPASKQGWKSRRQLLAMEECGELGKSFPHRQRVLVSRDGAVR